MGSSISSMVVSVKCLILHYPPNTRCCIDQQNIEENLLCLPVWLSGCKQLAIICGPTYLERLWCIMEYFVFVQMGGMLGDVVLHFMPPESNDNVDSQSSYQGLGSPTGDGGDAIADSASTNSKACALANASTADSSPAASLGSGGARADHSEMNLFEFYDGKFADFDVSNADCHDPNQKDHLLAIIESGFGGTDGFNVAVKTTLQLLREISLTRSAPGASRTQRTSRLLWSTLESATSLNTTGATSWRP